MAAREGMVYWTRDPAQLGHPTSFGDGPPIRWCGTLTACNSLGSPFPRARELATPRSEPKAGDGPCTLRLSWHKVPTRSACCLIAAVVTLRGLPRLRRARGLVSRRGLPRQWRSSGICDLTGLAPSSTKRDPTGRAPLAANLLSYGACPECEAYFGARLELLWFDATWAPRAKDAW
jgi:hypothetical protein